MTNVRCIPIELKADGGLEHARRWAAEIARRRPEALATLEREGVTVESVFLERVGETHYLIYYMRAADVRAAIEAGQTIEDELQRCHRDFQKSAWKSGEALELLVDLELPAIDSARVDSAE